MGYLIKPKHINEETTKTIRETVSKTARQIMDEQISEEGFQQLIIEYAQKMGWMAAHFRSVRIQRADGSWYYATPAGADGEGFPDLVLSRERIIIAEIKKQKGRRSHAQLRWAYALARAKAEYYCWRPSDWEEIEKVLR